MKKQIISGLVIATIIGLGLFSCSIKDEEEVQFKPKINNLKDLQVLNPITENQLKLDKFDECLVEYKKKLELERIRAEKLRQEQLRKEQEERQRLEKLRLQKLQEQENIVVSRGNENIVREYTVNASHYIAHCSEGCTGRTRSGYSVSNTIYYQGYRIVASDLNVFPLYTKMIIEYPNGTKFKAIVLDSGGAIKGYKLDILVSSYDEAIKLGRQQIKIKVFGS